MDFSLSPFAPESLVLRDRLSRPVPRQPAQSSYSRCIWCLLTGIHSPSPRSATVSIRTVIRHWSSLKFIRSRNRVTYGVHYQESSGTVPVVLKVVQQTGASCSGNVRPSFPCLLLVQWALASRNKNNGSWNLVIENCMIVRLSVPLT